MISIVKTTIKLMLRNKGLMFFLLVTPIISTLILANKVEYELYKNKEEGHIIELADTSERAVYKGDNTAFIVKVYDGADNRLSEYVIETLADNGMFSVCRVDMSGMTYSEICSHAEKDAFSDRAGVILYLNENFDTAVLQDELSKGMEIFRVSDDKRRGLFDVELTDILSKVCRAGKACGGDTEKTVAVLDEISALIPAKQVVDLAGRDEVVLTDIQTNSKVQIGYAFAIITLGFVFCGAFAAHTVITEDNNKVYTRIMMTGTGTLKYFVSKFIVVFLMCLLQTGVLAICLMFVKGLDVGISMPVFLLLVFLLGLIFATISMLTGVLFGDIMSSNYAAFTIWTISSMLAGLFFPIGNSSSALKTLSYLMPQRWFFEAAERLIAGTSGAYPMIACVTAAYLIVIISLGSVGLKISKQGS